MDTNDVKDAFRFLETWDDRYELITELGKALPPLLEKDRGEQNLVPGCTTRTWLVGRLDPGSRAIQFRADAEGPLVRGLVALLLLPFQDKTPEEVLCFDHQAYIAELGLEGGLSGKRLAGVQAFFAKVKQIALTCGGRS
jgi:cysteine desulfuration protein SufE